MIFHYKYNITKNEIKTEQWQIVCIFENESSRNCWPELLYSKLEKR